MTSRVVSPPLTKSCVSPLYCWWAISSLLHLYVCQRILQALHTNSAPYNQDKSLSVCLSFLAAWSNYSVHRSIHCALSCHFQELYLPKSDVLRFSLCCICNPLLTAAPWTERVRLATSSLKPRDWFLHSLLVSTVLCDVASLRQWLLPVFLRVFEVA